MKDNYTHVHDKLFYVGTNIAASALDNFQDNLDFACECSDNCSMSEKCSCLLTSGGQNYDSLTSRFISTKNKPVFECKETCKCRIDICKNRVVQNGPLECLKIVKPSIHDQDKGYGLITTQFIGEY